MSGEHICLEVQALLTEARLESSSERAASAPVAVSKLTHLRALLASSEQGRRQQHATPFLLGQSVEREGELWIL